MMAVVILIVLVYLVRSCVFFFFFNVPLSIPGALQCDRCPTEFWSNSERSACIIRQLDFLAFNETLGITLTAVAVSGVTVTTVVFVVFLYYRQTPMVRRQILLLTENF